MMKCKVLAFMGAVFLFAGCKNENIGESAISSKSNISQEVITQSKSFDKASYAGLEHVFKDTENISSDGKFVLLVFGKNGCKWCDRLKEEIKENKQTQEMLLKDFQSYYINLSYSKIHHLDFDGKKDQKETSQLALEYGVRPTPTSIFINSKGEPIFGWPGYFDQKQMQVILEFISSGEYKKAKTQQEFFELLGQKLKEK